MSAGQSDSIAGTELSELTASYALRLIRARKISSEELVAACLSRIEAREPMVAAWTYVDPQGALDQARLCDTVEPAGLLHGVPIGFKDLCDTRGMPTAYGSRVWTRHMPARDATCVTMVRNAGGIILGKTVTPEFGGGTPGSTSNPIDRARTPGGSSSGSAAAVADRMVPLAVGTQTAASVIRPASYCGVVGYKPSMGLLSLEGVRSGAETFDSLGTFARSLEDTCLFRDILLGVSRFDAPPVLDRSPRLGFCRSPLWDLADDSARSGLENMVSRLSMKKAMVSEVTLPAEYHHIPELYMQIARFELKRTTAYEWNTAPDALSLPIRALHSEAGGITAAEYLAARDAIHRMRRRAAEDLASIDVIVTLATGGEASVGLASTGAPTFSLIWQSLGLPCLSLPIMTGPAGMPIGLQIVGQPFSDITLFSVARWILDALDRSDI